jgi:hypothetical protein
MNMRPGRSVRSSSRSIAAQRLVAIEAEMHHILEVFPELSVGRPSRLPHPVSTPARKPSAGQLVDTSRTWHTLRH